jgi:hypothetical protein
MNETLISVRGKQVKVPEVKVEGVNFVVGGKLLRELSVKDEEYVEGNPISEPERIIPQLKKLQTGADFFSFAQRIPDLNPRFAYPMRWDNSAAVSTKSYSDWWTQLSQETRRNVRLAGKRGVVVRAAPFDDDLVRGIAAIYNETPVRHGRRFWHYGKSVETVRRDNESFSGRSCFIGAYLGGELIGFIKMVYVDGLASIMQILSKNEHQDKRPTNALLAKAVEICSEKQKSFLLYCKYTYHRGCEDDLMEFKRRNGFQEVRFPRYYVPLSLKGKLGLSLKLHHGVDLLPPPIVSSLLRLRARYHQARLGQQSKDTSTAKRGVASKTAGSGVGAGRKDLPERVSAVD